MACTKVWWFSNPVPKKFGPWENQSQNWTEPELHNFGIQQAMWDEFFPFNNTPVNIQFHKFISK